MADSTASDNSIDTADKMSSRAEVLKVNAGSIWGSDKETLKATYKAIRRSLPNYGASIWSPQFSDSSCTKIAMRANPPDRWQIRKKNPT